jgi:hypothetical protein
MAARQARPGAGTHLGVAAAGLLALALSAAALLGLMAREAADPARTGPVIAFFPPAWPVEAVLLATARAGGMLRAAGWPSGLVEVHGDDPGLAARLAREGALLTLAPLPLELGLLAGCAGSGPPRLPGSPPPL